MTKLAEWLDLEPSHTAVLAVERATLGIVTTPAPPDSLRSRAIGGAYSRFAQIGAPATPEEVNHWLAPLLGACRAPHSSESVIRLRVEGIAFALAGKPRFLLSDSRLRELMLRYSVFPTAAEIWVVMEADFAAFETLRRAFNQLLGRAITASLPSLADCREMGWLEAPAVRLVETRQ